MPSQEARKQLLDDPFANQEATTAQEGEPPEQPLALAGPGATAEAAAPVVAHWTDEEGEGEKNTEAAATQEPQSEMSPEQQQKIDGEKAADGATEAAAVLVQK